MRERPRARFVAYGIAVAAPAVFLLLRWPLWPILGDAVPHMTFFPAVMLAAYCGGFWPGLLATILSAAAANYFLTGQLRALHVTSANDVAAVILFLLTGTMISALCESLHRAHRRILAEERRRAEEARRESSERFRILVQNSSDIVSLFDAQGTILYQAPSIERVLGHPSHDRIGRNIFRDAIVHPDDLQAKRAFFDEIVSRPGVPITADFRLRHANGSWRDIEAVGQNFLHDPSVAGIVANYRDITARKRAEAALRQSETRLHRLLDALPTAAYTCDTEGLITYFNERAVELWGRSPKLNHPDDRFCGSFKLLQIDGTAIPHNQCGMAVAIKEEREIKGLEVIIERADGSHRNVLAHINPLLDSDRRLLGAVNVVVDITDLKRAEEALRESEQRWRHLTEALPQLVWTATPDGSCDYFSTQWTQHTGVPEGELLGWRWLETLHPDDREPTRQFWTASIEERGPYDVEYRVRRSDGAYRWFKTRGVPIRDDAGRIIKWFGTCTDITDGKRQEEELRQAKESAEAANRAKDDFLANVSHEIRTPMNAILGLTDLVLDTPLAEDQRQSLKTVKSAADNLLGIINDLLDFSKIEAGKLELDAGDFSLRAAVGDTLHALAMRAHRKGLELVCNVQSDVPDALIGDAGRLRQVLLNLVGNAIKFTDAGEVVVEVDAAAEAAHNGDVALRFTVRDTGIGIPLEKQSSIFRAFEQEDTSTTRKYGGTGLGLTISAQLAALMGGKISVQSEAGRGSTFLFTARFGRQAQQPALVETKPPRLLRNLRVLVVDDNAVNRDIVEKWLRDWQMEPTSVADGMAAMDALWHGVAVRKPHSLLLLDARMPDTDGLTLAAKVRERAELSGSRIILLTSGDRPGDLARFRDLRIDGHLLKPVQQDELLKTIYAIMSRSGERMKDEGGRMKDELNSPSSSSILHPSSFPLRVLVAEDSEFNAQLMEKLLVRRGHTVRLVNNGRDALSLANAADFDLLLLDVHMPELDGFQVIQAIRERDRNSGAHLPVIALTARSRKEDREHCLAAGMDEFLSKPIRTDDLWAAIDRVKAAFPSSRQPRASLLDARVLLAACDGDDGILRGICQGLQSNLPAHLQAIREALESGDAPRLREAAHKLCGMVSAFSTVAGGLASDLEDHAARGQIEESRPVADQLQSVCDELMQLMANELTVESLQHEA